MTEAIGDVLQQMDETGASGVWATFADGPWEWHQGMAAVGRLTAAYQTKVAVLLQQDQPQV
jgi:hypothetical protein